MHELILSIFKGIRSFIYFLRIVCIFLIMLLLLYWIEHLTNDTFNWLNFIKPFFDSLLRMCDEIYSFSFNFFGAIFEMKYFSTLILFVIVSYIFKFISFCVSLIEEGYLASRKMYKKTEETLINKQLQANVTLKEVQISKYTIVINTQIKKKFVHREIKVDIDAENKIMTDFINQKTGKTPVLYNGGFLYQFSNFNKIDDVLDTIFKVVNSTKSMIECAVCIQIEDKPKQLEKLIQLKHFGKITIAADTAYRYKFNASHRYGISQVGIFQTENGGTIEVHEFKEIL